jgi:hypothetical protein
MLTHRGATMAVHLRFVKLAAVFTVAAAFIVAAGCYTSSVEGDGGGDVADDGNADDHAAVDDGGILDDGTGDEGGLAEHRECRTPADCGGRDCLRVPDEPGGYWLCRGEPPAPATSCRTSFDRCCDSSACTDAPDGGCYLTTSCGGAWMEQNLCVYDECSTAADCTAAAHGVCMPRDVRGASRNQCLYGGCRTAADCTAAAGGYCAPIDDPCCMGPAGFYCVYPGGCATDADCSGGLSCVPQADGSTSCDMAACPV